MKNYILSIAILALAGTPFLRAQQESGDPWIAYTEKLEAEKQAPAKAKNQRTTQSNQYQNRPATKPQFKEETLSLGAGTLYVTMEGFFATPTEDFYRDEKLNIAGLWGTCGTMIKSDTRGISFDLGGVLGIGGGSLKYTEYGYGEMEENKWTQFDVFVGGQAGVKLQFTERFSMTAGVTAGLDFRYMKWEYEYRSGYFYTGDDDNDLSVGVFYGVYLRADTKLTNRWALTASYRFMGTTSENEFEMFGDRYETEKDDYHVFTVGAKFAF